MKKVIQFLLVALIGVFLTACASDLPPEPKQIGNSVPIGKAIKLYDGYAPPYDVFDDKNMIFDLDRDVFYLQPGESLNLELKAEQENSFIYKYGHYYSREGWRKFEFTQETIDGSNWIGNSASTTISLSTDEIFSGENYIVAYSCKRYNNEWKCGCSDIEGPCNQWMLQAYEFIEIPPEPTPPTDFCTDSDGGINPNIKGEVTDKTENVIYTDQCLGIELIEHYCENGLHSETRINCNCYDGSCWESSTCTDSEDPSSTVRWYQDEFTKGTVEVIYHSNERGDITDESTDKCVDENNLIDISCSPADESGTFYGIGFGDYIYCENGCKDGTCLSSPYEEKIAEAYIKLAGFDYRVISASDMTQRDFSIKVDLNHDGIIGVEEDIAILKREDFTLKDYGILNYIGSGSINDDNPVMVFKDLETKDIIERSFSAVSQETCADSDGGSDFYVKGLTIGPAVDSIKNSYGDVIEEYDSCDESGILKEFYCNAEGKVAFSTTGNVQFDCVDGKFIEKEIKCEDSDGGEDLYVKGTTISVETPDGATDSCADDGMRVVEYSCGSDQTTNTYFYYCPNGCKDGACMQDETNTNSVVDAGVEETCGSKHYSMAFILLVEKGTEPSEEIYWGLESIKTEFAKRFTSATNDLVTMDTSYPIKVVEIDEMTTSHVKSNKKNILQELYADSKGFNFVSLFGEGVDPSYAGGEHSFVKNVHEGIGMSIFDSSEVYGDAALLGINYMHDLTTQSIAESDINTWMNGLLHETGHQWCCFVGNNFARGENNAKLEIIQQGIHFYRGLDSPHEGTTPMNSDTWVLKEDGFYERLIHRAQKYHPFQLYLMGVLPKSEYDTKYKLYDAGILGKDFNDKTATFYKEVSVNDIITIEGERSCT